MSTNEAAEELRHLLAIDSAGREEQDLLDAALATERRLGIEEDDPHWHRGPSASCRICTFGAQGGPSLDVPDEWLLSISIMEAARHIGVEMTVGHSWRELAMLTNAILADQLRARLGVAPEPEREDAT